MASAKNSEGSRNRKAKNLNVLKMRKVKKREGGGGDNEREVKRVLRN